MVLTAEIKNVSGRVRVYIVDIDTVPEECPVAVQPLNPEAIAIPNNETEKFKFKISLDEDRENEIECTEFGSVDLRVQVISSRDMSTINEVNVKTGIRLRPAVRL
jgi:hypothetical protein